MVNKHENTLFKIFIYLFIIQISKNLCWKIQSFYNIPVQKYSPWDKIFHITTSK